MSIWNKILLVLNILAACVMFYLAARALKTHQYWREIAIKLEQQIKDQEETARKLAGNFTPQELQSAAQKGERLIGVRQLQVELHKWLVRRGPAWFGCVPQRVDPATGQVTVLMPVGQHGLEVNSIVYVFDQRDVRQGGSFLGAFTVTGVGGQDNRQLQLKPTLELTSAAKQRLQRSAQTRGVFWALYRRMPPDAHDVLAELDEQTLQQILPQESVADFLYDGKIIDADQVAALGLHGKVYAVDAQGNLVLEDGRPVEIQSGRGLFRRQLRDYEILLRNAGVDLTLLADRIAVARRDQSYIQAVIAEVTRQRQFRQQERDELEQEKQVLEKQRDLLAQYRKTLEDTISRLSAEIQRLTQDNQRLVAQIAKIQLDFIRRVQERTREMAQAATR